MKKLTEKEKNQLHILYYYLTSRFCYFVSVLGVVGCIISLAADVERCNILTVVVYVVFGAIIFVVFNRYAHKFSKILYKRRAINKDRVIHSVFEYMD